MPKEVILQNFALGKHLSADVAEQTGAVAAAVRRARQQVLVQRHRVTKNLETKNEIFFLPIDCSWRTQNVELCYLS